MPGREAARVDPRRHRRARRPRDAVRPDTRRVLRDALRAGRAGRRGAGAWRSHRTGTRDTRPDAHRQAVRLLAGRSERSLPEPMARQGDPGRRWRGAHEQQPPAGHGGGDHGSCRDPGRGQRGDAHSGHRCGGHGRRRADLCRRRHRHPGGGCARARSRGWRDDRGGRSPGPGDARGICRSAAGVPAAHVGGHARGGMAGATGP